MPLDRDDAIPQEHTVPGDGPLQAIFQRVRNGNALPIVSHTAMLDMALIGYQPFKRFYAEYIHYPYPELPGMGQLANYDRYTNRKSDIECQAIYLDRLKNHIYRQARAAGVDEETLAEAAEQFEEVGASVLALLLGYPRLDRPEATPLNVLAKLPFKVYLTTSPMTFLEVAMSPTRRPLTRMCRWRGPVIAPESQLWQIPAHYKLDPRTPLVYHLSGLDAHPDPRNGMALPDSLAISEDNYLELLVNLAQGSGNDNVDRLPAVVRGALADDIILLGFNLDSWALRALYYGLIRPTGQEPRRHGVCVVQLSPDERERQEKYLQSYLDRDADFQIFWGDPHDFARKLLGERL